MTAVEFSVRPARAEDAGAISQLIATTLFRTNAEDYPAKVLERVAEANAPSEVLACLERREIFVALRGEELIGTVGIEGGWIKSLFVHPDWQRKGIGRRLMAEADLVLAARTAECVWLQSSLTAVDFYEAAGFEPMREIIDGEDRTILMKKQL